MLDNNKKEILDSNYVLSKIKNKGTITTFKKEKTKQFFLGIFLGIIIIVSLYFISDYSNVFHVSINGNVYLSDEDIQDISGININNKYLLLFPKIKAFKLSENELIDSANIELLKGRIVKITVNEKKEIAYLNDTDGPKILLEDGAKVLINKDNMYLINNVPLIEGFSSTQIETILTGFKDLNADDIANISEIHLSPISYDQNRMEIIMRDGNYIYVSWTGLELLKNYQSIVTGLQLNDKNACIYLDEITNSGYVSACPWQE